MLLFSSQTASRSEKRHSLAPDSDFWYTKIGALFGYGKSFRVTPDNAQGIPAVYACIRLLCFSTAQIALINYRRLGNDDRERAMDTQIGKLLRRPNRWQYAFQFKVMMMGHLLLRGNCFAQKVRDRRGQVAQLIPLNPTRMTVQQNGRGFKEYILDGDDPAKQKIFSQDDIFHCTGMTSDGLIGYSPIDMARRIFEGQMAQDEYHANFYENSARPSGILKMPGAFKDEEASKRFKKSWNEAHAGARNAHKVAVLEGGLEWQQIGLSSRDQDYVNEQKMNIETVARIFGVPPHMIQDLTRATFSNIEEQNINYVVHSLTPWLKNFEEALMFSLYTEQESDTFYIEFLVDTLLRGNYLTRQEGLAVQRQNGIISADEWRKLENMNAIGGEEGKALFVNGALTSVKLALNPPAPPAPGGSVGDGGTPANLKDPTVPKVQKNSFSPILDAAFVQIDELLQRIARKHEKWRESNAKKPNYEQEKAVYLQSQRQFIFESLGITVRNYLQIKHLDLFGAYPEEETLVERRDNLLNSFEEFYVEHAFTRTTGQIRDFLRNKLDYLEFVK